MSSMFMRMNSATKSVAALERLRHDIVNPRPAMRRMSPQEIADYADAQRARFDLSELSEPQMLAVMQMSGEFRHQAIWHDQRQRFSVPPFTLSTFVELRRLGLAYKPKGKRFHMLKVTAMPIARAVADELVRKYHIHAGYLLGRTGATVTLKCTCGWGEAIRAGGGMQTKANNALSRHLRTIAAVDDLRTALVPVSLSSPSWEGEHG
jgi:hypothetical protein